MKYILVSTLLFLLALPASAQQNLAEIDLRVNGVGSGDAYADVFKKLGRPPLRDTKNFFADNACSGKAETHVTLVYKGLKISFLGDGDGRDLSVYALEISSADWLIAPGIKIGAPIESVREKFGKADASTESNKTVLTYVTKENLGAVKFYFRNDRLIKVSMSETLC